MYGWSIKGVGCIVWSDFNCYGVLRSKDWRKSSVAETVFINFPIYLRLNSSKLQSLELETLSRNVDLKYFISPLYFNINFSCCFIKCHQICTRISGQSPILSWNWVIKIIMSYFYFLFSLTYLCIILGLKLKIDKYAGMLE